jgi:phosphoadenosine phosphosulfate reductase
VALPAALTRDDAPCLPDLDGASAEEVIAWAVSEFFPDLGVACSMQDTVLVDLAMRVDRDLEVFFLDTGFHFPETLATAERVEQRYGLRLKRLRAELGAARYDAEGTANCCSARKVAPLENYLAGKRAWLTGLRRAESPTRANARAVEWDAGRGLFKINPIVDWTDDDVARYIAVHDVIVNPLRGLGYDLIGCAPCTSPGRGREGRWSGSDKMECGLHLPTTRPDGFPHTASPQTVSAVSISGARSR